MGRALLLRVIREEVRFQGNLVRPFVQALRPLYGELRVGIQLGQKFRKVIPIACQPTGYAFGHGSGSSTLKLQG